MDARVYLEQYGRTLQRINTLQDNADRIRERAQETTVDMSREHVQSSGTKDKVGAASAALGDVLVDLMEEYDKCREQMADISGTLLKIKDPRVYRVLYLKYIELMPYEEIANEMIIGQRTAERYGAIGIVEVQHILDRG